MSSGRAPSIVDADSVEGRHGSRMGALANVLVHPMVSARTVARPTRSSRRSVADRQDGRPAGFKACLSLLHRWDTVSTITVFLEVATTRETPHKGLELEGHRQPQGKVINTAGNLFGNRCPITAPPQSLLRIRLPPSIKIGI